MLKTSFLFVSILLVSSSYILADSFTDNELTGKLKSGQALNPHIENTTLLKFGHIYDSIVQLPADLLNPTEKDIILSGPIQEEIIAGITASPNPADTYTDLSITVTIPYYIDIKIINSMGLIVKTYGVFSMVTGSNKVSLDIRSLYPGTYYVICDVGGFMVTKKLSII